MDRLRSHHDGRQAFRQRPALRPLRPKERGFTLLEVLFSIAILGTGLLAVALLIARSSHGAEHSRYMSMAAALASEKLEDLSRYPSADAQLVVPAGSTSVGSLTSDVSQPITVGATTTIYYYDNVEISASGGQTGTGYGAVTTVQAVANGAGGTCYNIFYHQPNGTVSDTQCNATAPATGPDVLTFHRRWLIESPVTVNGKAISGVRRITVSVTLTNSFENPPVTFQMSTIRQ
jgi:prepilin-type N-terminal cleavage/methylation domain-containing protein